MSRRRRLVPLHRTPIGALGVDPGVRAGALVDVGPEGTVRLTFSWVRRKRQGKAEWEMVLRWLVDRGTYEREPLSRVSELERVMLTLDRVLPVPLGCKPRAALEGLRPYPKSSKDSLLKLGDSAGMLKMILLRRCSHLWRPTSQQWRKDKLGINEARLGAKASELRAVKEARRFFDIDTQMPPAHLGHVAEAYWMARWAQDQFLLEDSETLEQLRVEAATAPPPRRR